MADHDSDNDSKNGANLSNYVTRFARKNKIIVY